MLEQSQQQARPYDLMHGGYLAGEHVRQDMHQKGTVKRNYLSFDVDLFHTNTKICIYSSLIYLVFIKYKFIILHYSSVK
jgi:hypothetical protein